MAKPIDDERAIFHAALSFAEPTRRAEYLAVACRENAELRGRVESLLAAHDRAGRFMQSPALDFEPMEPVAPDEYEPSQVIGQYKLLQKIGEGGFGVVYMAEQQQPIVRKVALKIIRLGMDTKQVIARFEAERQALAMMDHPNIAKVLDAGATGPESECPGRPYFVMELVRGIPLMQQCDQQKLTIDRRLRLFIDICGAIQHAHQKGIIHRDIKPTNVLVTLVDGEPVPKVIDFGIAKATQQRLTDKTLFTRFEQFIGTPAYMSPEQAERGAVDIDTRSDIYSLGVVLYELLTGTTPLEPDRLRASAYDETLRLIREHEAPTPSTRLSTLGDRLMHVAQQRGVDPRRLRQELHGDLDWIVIKSLEKDRTRRYSTATDLARDVQRYLDREAIEARPPSTAYKLRKFTHKHRRLLTTAAAFALLLIVGAAVSTWQAIRATSALADSQFSRAELALDKGQLLGEQGNANLAMLWMARSLRLAPADATQLRKVIRRNLAGWRTQIRPLRLVMPHQGRADAVAVSPDGTILVTAARLENLGVHVMRWDASSGRPVGRPIEHLTGMVLSLGFSPAADALALGYADGRVELLDTTTGEVRELSQQQGCVTAVVVSPDETHLLVACGDNPLVQDEHLDENSGAIEGPSHVQMLDVQNGEPLLDPPLWHERTVWTATFSTSGNMMVTHSGAWANPGVPGVIRFWDLTGNEVREPLAAPVSAMRLALNRDGTRLLTGHADFNARLWDLTGDRHAAPPITLPCNGPVGAVAFAPDKSGTILTGDFGGAIRLWDVATQQPVSPPLWHQNLIRSAVFSHDGRHVLSGAGDVTRLWEVTAATSEQSSSSYSPSRFPLAFSPDWQTILTQDEMGVLTLRDASTGKVIGGPIRVAMPLVTAAFSPDHKFAATIGVDREVHLWNLISGEHLSALHHGEEPGLCAAFSPDGETVAVGFHGAIAQLWEVSTGDRKGELRHEQHSGPVFSISFHPNGHLILTGGSDSFARLWDASTKEEVAPLRHDTGCWGTFSPDGSLVVTASTDHNARIWDVRTCTPRGPALKHSGVVTAAVFSRDGRTVLTSSTDRTARLWDVATGKQLGPSMQHAGEVMRVGFGPDGAVLTSEESVFPPSAPPSPARVWRVPPPPEGADDQIELWAEVMTGMALDENGGARVLEVDSWRERTRRLRQSGFAFNENPQDTVSTNSVLSE